MPVNHIFMTQFKRVVTGSIVKFSMSPNNFIVASSGIFDGRPDYIREHVIGYGFNLIYLRSFVGVSIDGGYDIPDGFTIIEIVDINETMSNPLPHRVVVHTEDRWILLEDTDEAIAQITLF